MPIKRSSNSPHAIGQVARLGPDAALIRHPLLIKINARPAACRAAPAGSVDPSKAASARVMLAAAAIARALR